MYSLESIEQRIRETGIYPNLSMGDRPSWLHVTFALVPTKSGLETLDGAFAECMGLLGLEASAWRKNRRPDPESDELLDMLADPIVPPRFNPSDGRGTLMLRSSLQISKPSAADQSTRDQCKRLLRRLGQKWQ